MHLVDARALRLLGRLGRLRQTRHLGRLRCLLLRAYARGLGLLLGLLLPSTARALRVDCELLLIVERRECLRVRLVARLPSQPRRLLEGLRRILMAAVEREGAAAASVSLGHTRCKANGLISLLECALAEGHLRVRRRAVGMQRRRQGHVRRRVELRTQHPSLEGMLSAYLDTVRVRLGSVGPRALAKGRVALGLGCLDLHTPLLRLHARLGRGLLRLTPRLVLRLRLCALSPLRLFLLLTRLLRRLRARALLRLLLLPRRLLAPPRRALPRTHFLTRPIRSAVGTVAIAFKVVAAAAAAAAAHAAKGRAAAAHARETTRKTGRWAATTATAAAAASSAAKARRRPAAAAAAAAATATAATRAKWEAAHAPAAKKDAPKEGGEDVIHVKILALLVVIVVVARRDLVVCGLDLLERLCRLWVIGVAVWVIGLGETMVSAAQVGIRRFGVRTEDGVRLFYRELSSRHPEDGRG